MKYVFTVRLGKKQKQKCLNMFFSTFYFQDNLKRKTEYLAQSDKNDNPERKKQKTDISANEQLNTLVTQWFKKDANKGNQCFGPII